VVSSEFIIENLPEVAIGTIYSDVKRGDITQCPFFPRGLFGREKIIDKLHEQATVLQFKVLNSQPTLGFARANTIPGN
jgi:hypothetical protein